MDSLAIMSLNSMGVNLLEKYKKMILIEYLLAVFFMNFSA